jgi:hypothetical protein
LMMFGIRGYGVRCFLCCYCRRAQQRHCGGESRAGSHPIPLWKVGYLAIDSLAYPEHADLRIAARRQCVVP